MRGLGEGGAPLKKYWHDPTTDNRKDLMGRLGPEGLKPQYLAGVSAEDVERVAPENWLIDQFFMEGYGKLDLQLDLFGDYKTNLELYPAFQVYFRERLPPMLIVWGRHDPFFTVSGARAFLRDLPRAELHLLEASHLALETQAPRLARLVTDFLARTIS